MNIFKTIGALALVLPGFANAGVVYNSTLSHGVYFGTGNSDGAFVVSTDDNSGFELGLRAKYREHQTINSDAAGVYTVPTGSEASIFPGTAANLAAWNFEFSIDLRPGNSGQYTLGQIVAELIVTDITSGVDGASFSFDPLNSDIAALGGETPYAAQNSFNPVTPTNGFDFNAVAKYRFDLNVYARILYDSNAVTHGSLLATDSMIVNVVGAPEPASLGMIGFGLIGVATLIAKRRKNK